MQLNSKTKYWDYKKKGNLNLMTGILNWDFIEIILE